MQCEDKRKIIHVDMDAFYAAVEQRNNPALRGRPVVVGGRPDSRGVVSTCSYEARRYGIHSAMSSAEAYRLCPHAVFVHHGNFSEYIRVSEQIRAVFREVSDIIEPLSLDEAYIDVTVNKQGEPSASRLARWIRLRIFQETGLTASAGVSYNKSLAKIASDWKKPDGLTVITPQMAPDFLRNLPVRKFSGIGPVTAARMETLGIHTAADLQRFPLWRLIEIFGKAGSWYYDICRGMDSRPVMASRSRKSFGKENTFERDIVQLSVLQSYLEGILQSIWHEVQKRELRPRTLTVKIKYADFTQVTRSESRRGSIDSLDTLRAMAFRLLSKTEAGSRAVRLAGASLSSFLSAEAADEARQLTLGF